jgi:hypothetical protein
VDHKKFDEAVKELDASAQSVRYCIDNDIPQAAEVVHGRKSPTDGSSPAHSAELCLRKLSGQIDDCMVTFDRLMRSIDMPTVYASMLSLRRLSDHDWRKVRAILEQYSD